MTFRPTLCAIRITRPVHSALSLASFRLGPKAQTKNITLKWIPTNRVLRRPFEWAILSQRVREESGFNYPPRGHLDERSSSSDKGYRIRGCVSARMFNILSSVSSSMWIIDTRCTSCPCVRIYFFPALAFFYALEEFSTIRASTVLSLLIICVLLSFTLKTKKPE